MVHKTERLKKTTHFERKNLWKIYGSVGLQNGDYERTKNEDLEMLFIKLYVRLFLKANRLEWAGHVWRAVFSLLKNVLKRNPPKK